MALNLLLYLNSENDTVCEQKKTTNKQMMYKSRTKKREEKSNSVQNNSSVILLVIFSAPPILKPLSASIHTVLYCTTVNTFPL